MSNTGIYVAVIIVLNKQKPHLVNFPLGEVTSEKLLDNCSVEYDQKAIRAENKSEFFCFHVRMNAL